MGDNAGQTDRQWYNSCDPVHSVDPLQIQKRVSAEEERKIVEVGHGDVDEIIFGEEVTKGPVDRSKGRSETWAL